MDLKTFTFFVSNLSDVTELIPALLFLKYAFNRQPYIMLGYYLIISASVKIFTVITAVMGIHNMPAFHLLVMIEVVFLYSFYARIIYGSPPRAWVISILILLSLLNSLFSENIYQFNSMAWTFSVIFLLCLGLRYLYKLYDDLENIQLTSHPLFIINTGLLIYFAGSLFTFIFGWEILSKEAKGFFHNAWVIQGFSGFTKNIIVSYGLWLARYK
jgi:hypothetical protein